MDQHKSTFKKSISWEKLKKTTIVDGLNDTIKYGLTLSYNEDLEIIIDDEICEKMDVDA